MNSMIAVVALFAALASTQAGLIVGPSAHILQGPSSRSTIVGPDGSSISSVAPGGQIITEEHAGVVAHSAPVLAHSAVVAHSAPVVAHSAQFVAHSAPIVAHSAPVWAHSAQVLAHSAPVVAAHHGLVAHGADSTVISGPSGVISTNSLGHPSVVAHGVHGVHGVHGIHAGVVY
ncbi:unnamed protein product [Brassicogethes aeneus]|uniref:Uncharacterized protein n=1 Tax=Brassicogethes aeneus TaxID=1431903 RepID=A0A9P0FFB4_BRAAE|nr:unnamed protein product [Brassicogethes aeneus]